MPLNLGIAIFEKLVKILCIESPIFYSINDESKMLKKSTAPSKLDLACIFSNFANYKISVITSKNN